MDATQALYKQKVKNPPAGSTEKSVSKGSYSLLQTGAVNFRKQLDDPDSQSSCQIPCRDKAEGTFPGINIAPTTDVKNKGANIQEF